MLSQHNKNTLNSLTPNISKRNISGSWMHQEEPIQERKKSDQQEKASFSPAITRRTEKQGRL